MNNFNETSQDSGVEFYEDIRVPVPAEAHLPSEDMDWGEHPPAIRGHEENEADVKLVNNNTEERLVVGHLGLPLRTPGKRLMENGANGVQGVRKRALSPSSPVPSSNNVEVKKRLVAKSLVFGSSPLMPASGVARSIFGAPSEEDNMKVKKSIEEKLVREYEQFKQRWGWMENE